MSPVLPAWRRHIFFVLSALAVLMGSIDGTIVAVALPELTTSLNTSLSWISWTLTSYSLVQVVMYPLAGKLSEALGRRRVFLFCVVMFTASSVLCGLAPNVGWLIVFRALQAIGGGGLMPSTVGIIADEYRSHRAQAIGLISSVMPIGSIVGPNLGGFILQNWSWRALFWINVPIGIAVIAGVLVLVPAMQTAKQRERPRLDVDLLGLAEFTVCIVSLMYGMTLVAEDPGQIHGPLVWCLFVISIGLAVAFVRHVKRTPNPVMEYGLLARNPFLAANIYSFLMGAVTMGFYSFIPYYAVVTYGMSPFESGAILTPRAVVVVVTSVLTSVYVIRLGNRLPMLVGMGLVALTLVLLSRGWTDVSVGGIEIQGFWLLSAIIAIGGLGMGLSNPASNNAALDLAPNKAAALTGIRGTFRLTGGAVSVSGVVLALSFFPDPASGLATIFLVFAGILLVAVPLVLMIPDRPNNRRAPAEIAPREITTRPNLVLKRNDEAPVTPLPLTRNGSFVAPDDVRQGNAATRKGNAATRNR
jgi:EmrB/QacA subfamily drug resistance transporter